MHAHDLSRKRKHLGALFFGTVICAAGLFFLISQFTAGVTVKANDITMQLDPIYETTIQGYLSERPVERLRFLLNEAELNRYLQSKTTEVSGVRVEGMAGFGKSSFILTMRAPIAGWSVAGQQRYVDATGVSFDRNYYKAPAVQIIDKSGIPAQPGQAVASNRFLGFVGRMVGQAKRFGYTATEVIIPERTTRQVQIRVEGVTFPTIVSIDRGAGEQMEDMARSIQWLKAHAVTPEYLDVRVSGKAFYK
ncbi:hypothetical protein PV379_02190 [Streptomyces caniscabiei]|uniref:hypothetical protein n=1 Tax=Streptomyces caniscabiei TaxID=2746961 RepID=UPI0029BACE34|nr:hypothetical protein [Streptomyces caniscabiei]MDX2776163.1 hypothetical protein [Streptomyces caniscabiei]